MEDKKKNRRIKFSIELPSVALKGFVEKALKDENFFIMALENPIGAMEKCGVNLELSAFAPEDFATFFGALAGVKKLIEKKKITDISFESIFGEAADIRGSYMMAEMDRGICQDFNRGAFIEKGKMLSFKKEFSQDKGRKIAIFKNIQIAPELRIEIGGVGNSSQSSESNRGRDTDWDKRDAVATKGTREYSTKTFDSVILSIEDIMRGPLIHPTDLASLSARLETFIGIEEKMEF